MSRFLIVLLFTTASLLFLPAPKPNYIPFSLETVHKNEAWVDFPESVDFRLQLTHDEPIIGARLLYGVEALSCGEVTAVHTPQFDPTIDLDISWRWPILQGQLIPPGGQFWWQWELETESGETLQLDRQTAPFLDDWFVWQSVSQNNINVHWYRGPQSLGQDVLSEAVDAVEDLTQETGVTLEEPFDIYLYDESFDLQVSLPGAPAWAGGAAFPEHNVLLVTANPEYMTYALRTTRHEVGHLVIGRLTFNCTNHIPTWLNEGLAQVAEGEVEEGQIALMAEAIENNSLLTFPQLEGSFSIHAEQAFLSYAQSYDLVRFMIDTYGQEQMLTLLETYQQGATTAVALEQTYGLTLNELEAAWRESIGAEPLVFEQATDDAPTAVPTLALMGGQPTAVPATTTPIPTATLQATATAPPTQPATAVAQIVPTEPATTPIPAIVEEPNSRPSTLPIIIVVASLLTIAAATTLLRTRKS